MDEIEREARELLAAECRKEKLDKVALDIQHGMHASHFADVALRAIAAALRSAQVPEGWVLVPREPTPEMVRASFVVGLDEPDWLVKRYRAMLAAAPSAEGV